MVVVVVVAVVVVVVVVAVVVVVVVVVVVAVLSHLILVHTKDYLEGLQLTHFFIYLFIFL